MPGIETSMPRVSVNLIDAPTFRMAPPATGFIPIVPSPASRAAGSTSSSHSFSIGLKGSCTVSKSPVPAALNSTGREWPVTPIHLILPSSLALASSPYAPPGARILSSSSSEPTEWTW